MKECCPPFADLFPLLALEELVAQLPLSHFNQFHLFKDLKSPHMKTSVMEVSHGFPY